MRRREAGRIGENGIGDAVPPRWPAPGNSRFGRCGARCMVSQTVHRAAPGLRLGVLRPPARSWLTDGRSARKREVPDEKRGPAPVVGSPMVKRRVERREAPGGRGPPWQVFARDPPGNAFEAFPLRD